MAAPAGTVQAGTVQAAAVTGLRRAVRAQPRITAAAG
jgi:hypothetical protein